MTLSALAVMADLHQDSILSVCPQCLSCINVAILLRSMLARAPTLCAELVVAAALPKDVNKGAKLNFNCCRLASWGG